MLSPWVIIEEVGTLFSAHCDCMTGLTDVCTRIAFNFGLTLLPKEENHWNQKTWRHIGLLYLYRKQETNQKDWLRSIFSLSAAKTSKLNQSLLDWQTSILSPSSTKNRHTPSPPLPNKLYNLYSDLNNLKGKPVLLSVLPNYCETFSKNQNT